jgi:uncharacterized protein
MASPIFKFGFDFGIVYEGMPDTLIILGASTRAAATSALRAGWTPWCADLFADADLERIATVRKVPSHAYPHGLLDALKEAPPGPVLYTGALENWPDLVAGIDRQVLGNGADVLRAIRSPSNWTACLREKGVPCPALASAPMAGRWLLKPRKSAAGYDIAHYDGRGFNPRTHFLQEWIDGVPCSATFLNGRLIGVTQQLIGTPWLNATGFHYAGNIGPLPIDRESVSRWQAIGDALAKNFALMGLFGVDAIVRDGVVWPIEINPRYTASMELLERAYGTALLPMHGDAFADKGKPHPERREGWGSSPALTPDPAPGGRGERIHGKAILYARNTIVFPSDGPWRETLRDGVDLDRIEFADLPHAGDIIERGRPVLTLFASGASSDECAANLQEKAQALDRMLFG